MSWEQLRSIYREAAQDRADEQSQLPRACPNDGEPLKEGPDGQLGGFGPEAVNEQGEGLESVDGARLETRALVGIAAGIQ